MTMLYVSTTNQQKTKSNVIKNSKINLYILMLIPKLLIIIMFAAHIADQTYLYPQQDILVDLITSKSIDTNNKLILLFCYLIIIYDLYIMLIITNIKYVIKIIFITIYLILMMFGKKIAIEFHTKIISLVTIFYIVQIIACHVKSTHYNYKIIIVLYKNIIISLYKNIVIPLYKNIVIPLHYIIVIPLHYIIVILLYKSIIIPFYKSIIIPFYKSIIILLYYIVIIPFYYIIVVPLHYIIVILLYKSTIIPFCTSIIILLYYIVIIPLYYIVIIPLYYIVIIPLYYIVIIPFYKNIIIPFYKNIIIPFYKNIIIPFYKNIIIPFYKNIIIPFYKNIIIPFYKNMIINKLSEVLLYCIITILLCTSSRPLFIFIILMFVTSIIPVFLLICFTCCYYTVYFLYKACVPITTAQDSNFKLPNFNCTSIFMAFTMMFVCSSTMAESCQSPMLSNRIFYLIVLYAIIVYKILFCIRMICTVLLIIKIKHKRIILFNNIITLLFKMLFYCIILYSIIILILTRIEIRKDRALIMQEIAKCYMEMYKFNISYLKHTANIQDIINLLEFITNKLTQHELTNAEQMHLHEIIERDARLCAMITNKNILKENKASLKGILGDNIYKKSITYINTSIALRMIHGNDLHDNLCALMNDLSSLLQVYFIINAKTQPGQYMRIEEFETLCSQFLLPKYQTNLIEIFNKIKTKIQEGNNIYDMGISTNDIQDLNKLLQKGRAYEWTEALYRYVILKCFIDGNTKIAELINALELCSVNHHDQKLLDKFKQQLSEKDKKKSIGQVLDNQTHEFINEFITKRPDLNYVKNIIDNFIKLKSEKEDIPQLNQLDVQNIISLFNIAKHKPINKNEELSKITQLNIYLCDTIIEKEDGLQNNRDDLNKILIHGYNTIIKNINNTITKYNNSNNDVAYLQDIMNTISELLQRYIAANAKIQPSADMSIKEFKKLCKWLLPAHKIANIRAKEMFKKINDKIDKKNNIYDMGISTNDIQDLNKLLQKGRAYEWTEALYRYVILKCFLDKNVTMQQLINILQLLVVDHKDQKTLFMLKMQFSEEATESIINILGKNTDKFINKCNSMSESLRVCNICNMFIEYIQQVFMEYIQQDCAILKIGSTRITDIIYMSKFVQLQIKTLLIKTNDHKSLKKAKYALFEKIIKRNTHLCSMIKQNKGDINNNKVDLNDDIMIEQNKGDINNNKVDLNDDILENSLYNQYIQNINKQINEYNNSDDISTSDTTVDSLNSIMYKIAELLQMYITTNLKIQPSKDMTIGQFKKLCNQLLLPQHNKTDEIFNKIIKQNTTKKITDDSKLYETLGIEKADSKKLQQLWKEGRLYKWIKQLVTYIIIKYFLITEKTTTEELIEILQLFVIDGYDQWKLEQFTQQLLENNKTKSIQAVLGDKIDGFVHNIKLYNGIWLICDQFIDCKRYKEPKNNENSINTTHK